MRASDSWSCPEEASASKPAQEGFWFLWAVLSCLSGPGGSSCCVLYCPVCLFSPGGLLIPPHFPREILGGVVRVPAVGARPRGPRPRPPKTICHGLQSSQLRHGLQSSLHRHGLQSSQLRHGLQSSQLGTSLSGGGSNVSPLSCVCHVFPPLVSTKREPLQLPRPPVVGCPIINPIRGDSTI